MKVLLTRVFYSEHAWSTVLLHPPGWHRRPFSLAGQYFCRFQRAFEQREEYIYQMTICYALGMSSVHDLVCVRELLGRSFGLLIQSMSGKQKCKQAQMSTRRKVYGL